MARKSSSGKTTLHELLTEDYVRSISDAGSWSRGKQYARDGSIAELSEFDNRITAMAYGQRAYTVELWVEEGELGHECSCPMGDEGVFCKHCVAAALLWIEREGGKERNEERGRGKKGKTKTPTAGDARKYLLSLPKEDLVEMAVVRMRNDKTFRQEILLRTGLSRGGGLSVIRARLKEATRNPGFIDYYESHDVAREITDVIKVMRATLSGETATEMISLCEEGLGWVDALLLHADDSNGEIGETLGELETLHHDACLLARPDPVRLAERLFEMEMAGSWDAFYNLDSSYSDVLGKKGVERYYELVMEAWRALPPLKAGQNEWEGKRWHLTELVKRIAAQRKDDDFLLRLLEQNRHTYYGMYELACFYSDRNDLKKAVEIAEEGLEQERHDERLREFLIELYGRQGQTEKAMALRWDRFVKEPSLPHYQRLIEGASTKKEQKKWQERAIEHVRENLQNPAPQKNAFVRMAPANGSLLVAIHLADQKPLKAWGAALEFDCRGDQWLHLADIRKDSHPNDALNVWYAQIDKAVNQTNAMAYEQAVDILKKVRALMTTLKKESEFAEYLAALRLEFRRKRNFMDLLKKEFGERPGQ